MARRACRVGVLPRLLGFWLLLLLAAGSAVGQDDGRVSAPSDEQVERWLATLRAFEMPEPGPISSEAARLKSEILREPLEQMPPPVRAGYILCQVAIYDADGNWDGFVELRRRVTDPKKWVYAPEDIRPLRVIASYYDHTAFSPPGGLSGNSSDQYSSAHWYSHYRNKADYIEVMEYAIERADPTDATAVDMGYLLANEIKEAQPDRAEALLKELDAIPLESLTAAPIYDREAIYLDEDWIVKGRAMSINSMREYLSGEMDRRIEEAARPRHEESERRREPAAGSAVGQDDGRASAPSGEQVERWLATLRAFEVPQPGPISSETARLMSEILRAPLEQMPPEVRTGYAFCQIAIHYNDGNWQGVQALRERILNTETWPRADQDAEVLLRIAGYDYGSVFPAPGGRAVGQPEKEFRSISVGNWEREYQNWDRYFSTLERIATETDPLSFGAAAAILRLAQEKAERGKLEEAEEWVRLLGIESAEELHGVPYYDRHGNYVTPEQQIQMKYAEALQCMLEDALYQIAILKHGNEAGLENPLIKRFGPIPELDTVTTGPVVSRLGATPAPGQQARPASTPAVAWGGNPSLPPEERAIPPDEPAPESPGDAGGRTRLWLLLGVALAVAAAAVAGVLLARRAGAKR